MGNFLCIYSNGLLFMIIFNKMCQNVNIYFYCMLKVCKKTDIQQNIYLHNTLHNNLGYIAQLYIHYYIPP